MSLLESVGVIGVVAFLFYQSPLAVPFLVPLVIPVSYSCRRRRMRKQHKERTEQFKEMMTAVLTSLRAGYSAENAIRDSYREMEFQYGAGSWICTEILRIIHGMNNRIPVEKLLLEFSERSGLEEVKEFAQVFVIARKKGGNMSQILQRSISLIQSRIDVESEIAVMISQKRMEQTIMDVVPFVIILYIRMTSPGFFDVLYHNAAGVMIMTICLAVYCAALLLSEKIIDIRV